MIGPNLANKPKPVESSESAAPKSNDDAGSSNISSISTSVTSLSERRAAARERMLGNRRIQQKRIASVE
jgi:hypothetical protein